MYRTILVPLDRSATAQRGLKHAIALARDSGARLRLVHVVDETSTIGMMEGGVDVAPVVRQLTRSGRELLERGRRLARNAGVRADAAIHESLGGAAADTILSEAKKSGADLIVMGTHGRRGLRHVVLGSVAERVVHRSRVPVLLVRADD